MKFEHTKVWGFEHAIRGMRNPKESWERIDSDYENIEYDEKIYRIYKIGPNDLKLMQSLIRGGSEHRKFMRQIFVSVDITASLAWWKEFDTYKVGTTANSTSTMHKISSKPITLDLFEIDNYRPDLRLIDDINLGTRIDCFISDLEQLRQKFLQTNDKAYWYELIRWMPEGWLQTRTVTMNYENIYNMICHREYHKQNNWSGKDIPELINFISWTKMLPLANQLFKYNSVEVGTHEIFDKYIILICGESGSGKSTIAEALAKKYDLNILQSYTTRNPRSENESGHIFIDDDTFDSLTGMVAYTEFDGHRYCATCDQVETSNIYIIDPDGITSFKEKYTGTKKIIPIYIRASENERKTRMSHRGDSEINIQKRIENDNIKFANVLDTCEVMFSNHDNEINTCIDNIYNYIIQRI